MKLIKLEKTGATTSKEAAELYELASVQLRKRLYPQATSTLKKALKNIENEPDEARAVIENALGFALAAQDDFEASISHYRTAIKAKSNYPVAINNLAFAQEKMNNPDEALGLYKEVLKLDPQNKTANKQLKRLLAKETKDLPNGSNSRGF